MIPVHVHECNGYQVALLCVSYTENHSIRLFALADCVIVTVELPRTNQGSVQHRNGMGGMTLHTGAGNLPLAL